LNFEDCGDLMKNAIIKITSGKFFLIFSLVLYKIFIDVALINIISDKYEYMGFGLDINYIKVIESYIIIVIFSFFLKHRIRKPSDFFILFLFSMIMVPLTSIFSLQDKDREFMYYMVLSFIVIIIFSKTKNIRMLYIKNGHKIVFFSTIVIGILLFGWIIMRGGLKYLNFNLFAVYDFRRTVAELIFPGYLAYLMTWFGKVMNPFIIAYNLWRKNKTGAIIAICVQILFFAITAHKSILFYPIITLFVYKASQKSNFAQMVPFGLAMVNFFSIVVYYFNGSLTLITLFSRRVLLLTSKIHYQYYDFFKENGFLYYSNRDWFPKIIDYPYSLPIQLVINDGVGGWANTGFLANGYIHFGLIGMIIYSIIVGVIFSYIDYISKNHLPTWVCIGIMIAPVFSLTSGDLPTVLLNHGLILAVIILWLMCSSSTVSVLRDKNNKTGEN
jgi:hypothetical protein